MKIIKGQIFWECIASSFLDLKDMALFEVSITNHDICLLLSLPTMTENRSSPYEINVHMNEDKTITIDSEDMMSWCKKRKFKLPNIRLTYDPTVNMNIGTNTIATTTTTSPISSNRDLLHYVRKLTVVGALSETSKLFARLKSLESLTFSVSKNAIEDITSMVEKLPKDRFYQKNSSSLDHHHSHHPLEEISLSYTSFSITALEELVRNFPYITSVKLPSSRSLSDAHLDVIAKGWKKLSTLHLGVGNITNKAFEPFYKQNMAFRSISLSSCACIDYDGIKMLLFHSAKTLMELRLTRMYLTEDEVISLLSLCPILRILELSYIGNILYCDGILRAVAVCCPMITTLILPRYEARNTTDDRIMALTKGCKNIEVLYLGRCPNLTRPNIKLLTEAYSHSLKEITLSKSSTADVDISPFLSCQNKVKVHVNTSFD